MDSRDDWIAVQPIMAPPLGLKALDLKAPSVSVLLDRTWDIGCELSCQKRTWMTERCVQFNLDVGYSFGSCTSHAIQMNRSYRLQYDGP